jgi:hypothetical protein
MSLPNRTFNYNITNTAGNIHIQNGTLGSINASSVTTGTLLASTGITTTSLSATTITGANLSIAGTLRSVNVTSIDVTTGGLVATGKSVLSNVTATGVSASTLNVSTGITAGDVNITGSLYQNGGLYSSSQWITTSGNVSYTSGSVVSTNLQTTSLSTNTLIASTGITTGDINFTGVLYQNGTAYAGSQWTTTSGNVSYTSGSVVASNLISTNASTGTLFAYTGITTAGLAATTITGANMSLSGTLTADSGQFTNGITSGNILLTSGGSLSLQASSSGTINITSQTSTGNFNFNLPTTAGSSGQMLLSGGGASSPMTWGVVNSISSLARYNVSAPSINNNSVTAVAFDTQYATYSVGTTGIGYINPGIFVNNNSFSITIQVNYTLAFASNSTGSRSGYIIATHNSNNIVSAHSKVPAVNGDFTNVIGSTILTLAPTEIFALYAFQNSGTSLSLGSGTGANTSNIRILVLSGAYTIGTTINATTSSNTLGSLITATSGNVGISATRPAQSLHVHTSNNSGGILITGTNASARIDFAQSNSVNLGAAASSRILCIDNNWSADLLFQNRNAGSDNTTMNTRMTIAAGGNVGIGTTSPNTTLHVNGSFRAGSNGTTGALLVSADSDPYIYMGGTLLAAPTGDARLNVQDRVNNYISFYGGTTKAGSITVNGGGVSFNTSSDYRVKENVVNLTGACSRVKQLSVKRFNFISHPDTTVDGFIAHEVATVVPEAITGAKDAVDANGDPILQAIDQSKLVPLLTAALQEVDRDLQAERTKVANLEADVSNLEAFIQSKFPGEYTP